MSVPAAVEEPALASSAEEELASDTAPVEVVEPWQSLTPPSVYTAGERGRSCSASAGAALPGLALRCSWWRSSPGGSPRRCSDNAQVVASSGALADSAARLQTAPAQTAPDTQPAAAAETTAVAAVDSSAAVAAKLTIAALKPIRVGDSASLRARLRNDPKAKLGTIAWTSSAPLVARVNSRTGRVIALKEGSATITGTVNGATGSVTVKVIPGTDVVLAGKVAVAKIITSDVPATLHAGDTVRVTAALGAKDENLLDRKVTWQSTLPDVASVDAYGLVTAHAPGHDGDRCHERGEVDARSRDGCDARGQVQRRDESPSASAATDSPTPSGTTTAASCRRPSSWIRRMTRRISIGCSRSSAPPTRISVFTRTQPGRPNVQNAEAAAEVVFTFSWTANGRSYDKKAKFRVNARKLGDVAIATLPRWTSLD